MENSCIPAPWLLPVIEHWGTRYLLDLKLRHFRRLSSPIEIGFESEQGKGMCRVVGVVRCSRFTLSVIHHGWRFGYSAVGV